MRGLVVAAIGACLTALGCTIERADVNVVAPPTPPATPSASASAPPASASASAHAPAASQPAPRISAPPSASSAPRVPPPPLAKHVKVTHFKVKGGALQLPGPIDFEPNSDVLTPDSDDALATVKDYLDAKPELTLLRIEGHTDSTGNTAANQTLSEKRALAVARWLKAHGVACDRLIAVGFGSKRPLVPNDTPEHQAQNRRVAFVNAALRKKAIARMPVDGGGQVAGDPCK